MARILVITQRVPYPPNKGEKLRTYHQLEYLRNLGHSITVFTAIDSEVELKNATDLATELNVKVITKPLSNRLLRFARGLFNGKSLSEANFFSNKLMFEVKEHANSHDVILCSASSLAEYAFKLQMKKPPLLLMDFMDVDSDKWLQYANNASYLMRIVYRREHRLIKALEQKTMVHFDHAFIIAQAEFDLFQKNILACSNLHVLGNGIDQNEFNPTHHSTEYIHFLFTGVMDYKPNVDAILWFIAHCWESIKNEVPNARLTIAGMNPEQKILSLTKDKTIEVTGFVDDIMPFFHRADIFIAPFQIARGVQNKVLQAMACAIPVVSTRLGAEGIISEQGTNMIIADSQSAFSEACLLLAKNKQAREKIGVQALQTITANYSWKGVLKPLKTVIELHRKNNENNS